MPHSLKTLEYLGETKTLSQWATYFNLPYARLIRRYNVGKSKGWSDAQILEECETDLNSGDRRFENYRGGYGQSENSSNQELDFNP